MMILVAAMFLLPLGLVALYLYVSGVFTNRRAFQFGFYILLVFFALTIGIGIHSCQGYDLPATTPVSLSEGFCPKLVQLCNKPAELHHGTAMLHLAEQHTQMSDPPEQ